jgi:hypothetical protein
MDHAKLDACLAKADAMGRRDDAYKGYSIKPSSDGKAYVISRQGMYIMSAASLEEAKKAVDKKKKTGLQD